MRFVVGARLFFGDGDLLHHVLTLDFADQHVALHRAPQLGERQAFLLQRLFERRVVFELVIGPNLLDDVGEPLVGDGQVQFLRALQEQQLVDRLQHDLRRDFVERLAQLRVVLQVRFGHLAVLLAERRDLTLFQVALGEDLAIHLDQDLLDDLGAHRQRQERHQRRGAGRDQRLLQGHLHIV